MPRRRMPLTPSLILALLPSTYSYAHTFDIIELAGKGTEAVVDGTPIAPGPDGAETITAGANLNDGNYLVQLLNVNIYDDPQHTLLSDTLTITVPIQNPPQITLGFTSDALTPLSPESIAITETEGLLQPITTLTNDHGISTTIRLLSLPDTPTPIPEPTTTVLLPAATALLLRRRHRVRVL